MTWAIRIVAAGARFPESKIDEGPSHAEVTADGSGVFAAVWRRLAQPKGSKPSRPKGTRRRSNRAISGARKRGVGRREGRERMIKGGLRRAHRPPDNIGPSGNL